MPTVDSLVPLGAPPAAEAVTRDTWESVINAHLPLFERAVHPSPGTPLVQLDASPQSVELVARCMILARNPVRVIPTLKLQATVAADVVKLAHIVQGTRAVIEAGQEAGITAEGLSS